VNAWPQWFTKRAALVGSLVGIVVVLIIGSLIITSRPKAPPPSDPKAGPAAAEFCANAIGEAVVEKRIEISYPEPGRKFVRAIQYTNNAVRVIYEVETGQTPETVEYSAAIFITSLFSESTNPAWRLFGETSEPWLRCTQALQYFEQEKAKDVARELQDWVFGPPAPRRTLEGSWTLTRTLLSCDNLDEGCATGPLEVQFEQCDESRCMVSREEIWKSQHAVIRLQSGPWNAQFEDIGFACSKTSPRTLNSASYAIEFTLDDEVETINGTISYTASSNPPCEKDAVRASYEFTGKRTR